jgi:hypothetical protein
MSALAQLGRLADDDPMTHSHQDLMHYLSRQIEELRNQSSEQNTPVATPPEQADPRAPATGPDLLPDNTDAQEAAQEAQTGRNPKVRSLLNNRIASFIILICTGGPEKKAGRQRYYRPRQVPGCYGCKDSPFCIRT